MRLVSPAGPEALVCEQIPTPSPQPGEVLVRVHAAAITRDELEWPLDRLPAIPSYEVSGVVAALGPGVDELAVGQAVYGLTAFDRDGVAADYAAVPADVLAPKPQALSDIEASAIPLPALSAWQAALRTRTSRRRRARADPRRRRRRRPVRDPARPPARGVRDRNGIGGGRRAGASLGADQAIDHTTTRFEQVVDPVDVVFDTAGGERLARSPALLRPGGRLVSVAEEPASAGTAGRLSATYFVVEPDRLQLIALTALIERGELRPMIDATFALEDARAAFERSQANGKRGKVVLDVGGAAPAGNPRSNAAES